MSAAVTDASSHPLSQAFMRGHPAQAARVLETLPIEAAAPLFVQSPARLGAAVLTAMLPHRAALCVAALSDERALELLSSMGTQPTVALLRQMPEARRQRLIAGLPTAAAMASTLLLGYAEDALGAWADPDVVMLGAGTRVADALARLREAPPAHPVIFVADGERRLTGEVGVGALLQAPGAATLATLMRRPLATLRAHAPLTGTAAHPGWELASMLPVVEPGDRLVGVLTRDALARALRRVAPPAAQRDSTAGLPALMARGYWQALSGLMDAGLALLPRVAPVLAETDSQAAAEAQRHHDR
jgi:magnesium transporter